MTHRTTLSFSLVALAALACASLFLLTTPAHAQTCHLITSQHSASDLPAGFGVPWNTLTSAKELLIRASCGATSGTMDVGTGSDWQYIYKHGYQWRNDGWEEITFTGSQTAGDWLIGSAKTTLNRTTSEMSQPNWFVAYVCQWTGSQWKCGCRDQTCATPMWQLQGFMAASGGAGSGDLQMNGLFMGGIPTVQYSAGNAKVKATGTASFDKYSSYPGPNVSIFKAERTGQIDRVRFNLPVRENYYGGNGGIMRMMLVRVVNGVPDVGNPLYQWPDVSTPHLHHTLSANSPNRVFVSYSSSKEYLEGRMTTDGKPFSTPTPVSVTQGQELAWVWYNVHSNANSNWYSINYGQNIGVGTDPYALAYPYWAGMKRVFGTNFVQDTNKWPVFEVRYTDDVWTGPMFMDGNSGAIEAPDSNHNKAGRSREITTGGGNWQSRNRWRAGYSGTVTHFYARIWKRDASNSGALRVTLERELPGGGVETLFTHDIPASTWTQAFSNDNASSLVENPFPPIRVAVPNVAVIKGEWYRLHVRAIGSTRYRMRASRSVRFNTALTWARISVPTGGQPSGHSTAVGRAEYSINGGSTWTGMHASGTDNMSDLVWHMGLITVPK